MHLSDREAARSPDTLSSSPAGAPDFYDSMQNLGASPPRRGIDGAVAAITSFRLHASSLKRTSRASVMSQRPTSVFASAVIHNLSTPSVFVPNAPPQPPERFRVCNRSAVAERNTRSFRIALFLVLIQEFIDAAASEPVQSAKYTIGLLIHSLSVHGVVRLGTP
jgi:hypothetical protein